MGYRKTECLRASKRYFDGQKKRDLRRASVQSGLKETILNKHEHHI